MRRTLLLLVLGLLARDAAAAPDAVASFRAWMRRYQHGKVDLYQATPVPVPTATDAAQLRFYRSDGVDELEALLAGLVAQGDEDAARILMEAASLALERTPAEERAKHVAEQPWLVRRRSAEALGQMTGSTVGAWLATTPIRDNAPLGGARRRAVAALALAQGGHAGALDAIVPLLKDEVADVRATAASALGVLGTDAALAPLAVARSDATEAVRLEALLAIDRIAAREGSTPAARAARHEAAWSALEDKSGAVRFAAARILRDDPVVESMPMLVVALAQEQPATAGSRRRVRVALRDALASITGEDFPSYRPGDWADWWDRARGEFAIDPSVAREVVPEQGARFFGIPIEADVVVFLLDVSGSMDKPASGADTGASRLFLATRELRRCLDALEPGTRFNLVLFNDTVTPFAATPEPLDEHSRARVDAFLEGLQAEGGTDLFSALMFALGEGGNLSARVLGDEIDTLVVLTDGAPSRGPVLIPDEILQQVALANRGRRITIHTVCATATANDLLDRLAAGNDGQSR